MLRCLPSFSVAACLVAGDVFVLGLRLLLFMRASRRGSFFGALHDSDTISFFEVTRAACLLLRWRVYMRTFTKILWLAQRCVLTVCEDCDA